MWIVPKEGYQLIDPNSGMIVPAEGMNVPDGDLFWVRRLRDGDCTQGEAPAEEGEQREGERREDEQREGEQYEREPRAGREA